MLDHQQLLQYLSSAASFGGGSNVCFGEETHFWTLDGEQLAGGILSANTTREVLDAYAAQCPDVPYGEKPVPVVVCARWHVAPEDGARTPLLLIPATLDVGGALLPDPTRRPWIPWERLVADGTRGSQPTVCTLDTLRAHQHTMSKLPDDGTWSMLIARTFALFDAVCTVDFDDSYAALRIWDRPDELATTSRLLHTIASTLASKGIDSLALPLRAMLEALPTEQPQATNTLPNEELLDSKLLCGMLDVEPWLNANERAALMSFVRQHEGDLLAMHAPEGTNATTVALAAMANRLTECALRGERAPVMACFGSEATLHALSRALLNRPPAGQTSLPARWLPRIAHDEKSPEGRRTLGPIPTVAIGRQALSGDGDATELGAFNAFVGHPLLGEASSYSDAWYIPKATIYFLDCVSGYLGRRIRDVGEATTLLSERLRHIDQERCELIDAYANVCRASEQLAQRDELLKRIVELRGEYREAREALDRWDKLAAENPVRYVRKGHPEEDQRELIAKNTRLNETIPRGHAFVADVCEAYRNELQRIENNLESLRLDSAEITQRVRASSDEGQRCVQMIAHLQITCGLSVTRTKQLESTIDGRDVSLQRLDDMLDRTVRPAEFWLAVHIYEARWLSFAQRKHGLRRALCGDGVVSWRALSNLCPINAIPTNMASIATLDARGAHVQTPLPPFDLAVVLDADEMDVGTGAVVLGHASRALVLGSDASLGPQQPQGRTSDMLYAPQEVRDSWDELFDAHLVASGDASLARVLFAQQCKETAFLSDVRHAYGELDDLRSNLIPSESLSSARTPTHSADDPAYPLLGIVPTLAHVLVPDSSWQQVESSRTNRAEALAIVRWLSKYARKICERYETHGNAVIGVVSAYKEQARLLCELLAQTRAMKHGEIDVVSLREAKNRTWPIVVISATCGPTAYKDDCACDASAMLSLLAAHAQDAMVLFWGATWLKSDNDAALTYLRRSAMVGRLYSVVREGRMNHRRSQDQPRHLDDTANLPLERDLRAKPLSLTSLLRKLEKSGDLPAVPSTTKLNLALEKVGLIERVTTDAGQSGWRPTAAGREIGILATSDRKGSPFCSYAPSTEPVITSTAITLLEETE